MLDINNLDFEDVKTWKLLQSGNTSGVFQLETDLGKTWVKQAQPETLTDLSSV